MRRVLGPALGCVCAVALALAAPASAQVTLTVQPVPGVTNLNGVACSLPYLCVAVGSMPGQHGFDAPAVVPVVLGTPRTPEPVPGDPVGVLNGVACSSVAHCVAVGSGEAGLFGFVVPISGIRPTGSAGTFGDQLSDVACETASTCVAVGQYSTGAPIIMVAVPITNGSPGENQYPPTPAAIGGLSGVACTQGAGCLAVGTSIPLYPGHQSGVIEPYTNGTLGAFVPVSKTSSLNAVGCRPTTSCVAAGPGVVISVFAGAVTGTRTVPEALTRIACPRQNLCIGVSGSNIVPIFQGRPLPPVPVPGAGTLNGITCQTRFKCIAVGESGGEGVLVHVPARILALY